MSKTYTYLAIVHKDPDSEYGVSFPSMPGCVTSGRTWDEAFRNAEEALSMHISWLKEEGIKVASNPKEEDCTSEGMGIFKIRVRV